MKPNARYKFLRDKVVYTGHIPVSLILFAGTARLTMIIE
jgi:hypothetical protein